MLPKYHYEIDANTGNEIKVRNYQCPTGCSVGIADYLCFTINTGKATITTTPSNLYNDTEECLKIIIRNTSKKTVKIGGPLSQDLSLLQNAVIEIPINSVSKVFLRTDSGSTIVEYMILG
jgi:hypothetical protein